MARRWGRLFREGKAAISAELAGILERLGSGADRSSTASRDSRPAACSAASSRPLAHGERSPRHGRAPPGKSGRLSGTLTRCCACRDPILYRCPEQERDYSDSVRPCREMMNGLHSCDSQNRLNFWWHGTHRGMDQSTSRPMACGHLSRAAMHVLAFPVGHVHFRVSNVHIGLNDGLRGASAKWS